MCNIATIPVAIYGCNPICLFMTTKPLYMSEQRLVNFINLKKNLVEKNVGDCLSMEREEISNKRSNDRPSLSFQLRSTTVETSFKLGLRQPGQSVANRQSHQ